MKRYEFNKLIRSKLPERMEEEGVQVNKSLLGPLEYLDALKQKILEEAQEVVDASSKIELIEEIADLLEVIYSIAENTGINLEKIEQARLQKRSQNGHFMPQNYITYIEVSEDNNAVIEYLEKKNYVAV